MNPLKTIVFFLVFTNIIFSQTKTENDTILASQYFKKADSLLNDRKLDSSIVYFKKALPFYEKAKAWERVAGCYNRISIGYWRSRNENKSMQNSEKALYISNSYLSENNRQEAITYDNIGHYYRLTNEYDKALEHFKKALSIRQTLFPEEHSDISVSYSNIGAIYYYKSDYKNTVLYFEKVMAIQLKTLGPYHKSIVGTYNNLAVIYDELGDLFKALEYYKKASEIIIKESGPNDRELIRIYNNMGVTYINLKQYDNALSCYKKALPICVENNNLSGLDDIYMNMGVVFRNKGKYSKALLHYKKSLDIRIELKGRKHFSVGDIYMNMGVVFKNNEEFEKAQEYYNKALNNYEFAFTEKHIKMAEIYENIGNLQAFKKKYSKALEYQKKAFKIRKEVFQENTPNTIKSYGYIGDIYLAMKRFDDALKYYQKGLMILQNTYGNYHTLTSEFYQNIAMVYYELEEYDKAINYLDNALNSNRKKKNSIIGSRVFDLDQYYNFDILLEGLYSKAKILRSRYLQKKNSSDLEQSIAIYQEVDIIINQVRQSFKNYKDKVSFAELTQNIYSDAIAAHFLFYSETKSLKILEELFYYFEKSKSNILKELLTDIDAKEISGLSIKLMELGRNLKSNKAFYRSKINKEFFKKERDSIKIVEYENKLFDISGRQDSLTEVLEKNYPKYHQLKYNNQVISIAGAQQKLDDNTTLLEFFAADSVTYAFTISKNKFVVKELSTPNLDGQIEQFRSSITKNYEAYKESSYQLYQKLIAPVKDEFVGNQLIIVPDGSLWYLNFDLLLTREDASNNPKTWPYFLKEYAISYANSATLLFGNKVQEELDSKRLQECLAFSFSGDSNLADAKNIRLGTLRSSSIDLPGTREEIKAIANIVDGQYFYGPEATEQNFKKHSAAYSILHLALHGDVDNERPENSKLYFTKSKDTIEDNYLYSHELFALDIPAELTVLSACNTGTGKIAKGEGIMSLGNAFQYAGTKSLLLTNWEVSDETTPKIMEYFYSNLKKGKNKAEALQQAKLQFLTITNQETDHPYYWGGFYLLGDTTAIQFQDTNYKYWFIGFGVLALILVSLFWYRKKCSFS